MIFSFIIDSSDESNVCFCLTNSQKHKDLSSPSDATKKNIKSSRVRSLNELVFDSSA